MHTDNSFTKIFRLRFLFGFYYAGVSIFLDILVSTRVTGSLYEITRRKIPKRSSRGASHGITNLTVKGAELQRPSFVKGLTLFIYAQRRITNTFKVWTTWIYKKARSKLPLSFFFKFIMLKLQYEISDRR